MYSQANVRVERAAAPSSSVAVVIVDTENMLRETEGPVERDSTKKSASGAKVTAPGCVS